MTNKIIFDTLAYAKTLESAGIAHPEAHSEALVQAITHNIYTQCKIDKMIDASLKQFHERTLEMRREWQEEVIRREQEMAKRDQKWEKSTNRLLLEIKTVENKLEKAIHSITNRCISILGSLIVVVGVIATFAHSFFH